jgi:hypothetical protein
VAAGSPPWPWSAANERKRCAILEAMASALRVHPTELTGQPWTPHDVADAHTGLMAIETALERYELGTDP